MAHEKSVTVESDGGWVNTVGPDVDRVGAEAPGTVLKPLFGYEKPVYGSESEASSAAQKRSVDFGEAVGESMRHSTHRQWMSEAPTNMRRPMPQVRP